MPFVPAVRTAEIEVVYNWDGQIVENTLFYQKSTTPVLEDLAALTDEIRAYIIDQLLPALTSAISLIRVVGTLLDVVDGLQAFSTTDLPAAGGGGGGVPGNVTLAVSFKTANRGRSARGRNYIPGLATSYVTNSHVSSEIQTAFTTVWAGLRTIGGDDGWQQVVCSRFSGFTIVGGKKVPTPRTTAVLYPVTEVVIIDPTTDSQRRRLPGRGT